MFFSKKNIKDLKKTNVLGNKHEQKQLLGSCRGAAVRLVSQAAAGLPWGCRGAALRLPRGCPAAARLVSQDML